MENNKQIMIKYEEEVVATLDSNTPSLEELKKFIIKMRDTLDVNKINCVCEKENFDIDSFTETIKECLIELLSNIQLNEKKYSEEIAKLNER